MATYLLRIHTKSSPRSDPDPFDYEIHEGESARQVIKELGPTQGTVEVWTLRSKEPRTYEISTESVRTITQT